MLQVADTSLESFWICWLGPCEDSFAKWQGFCPPTDTIQLNKKYLRLEHTRPVITTQGFMLLRSTFSTGVSVLFHRWPTARFPFEYRSAYGSTSTGNCGPLGDSIHRGNGERDRDGNRKKPGQDVTAVTADTINLYGFWYFFSAYISACRFPIRDKYWINN